MSLPEWVAVTMDVIPSLPTSAIERIDIELVQLEEFHID
jgi:hypothetical protein